MRKTLGSIASVFVLAGWLLAQASYQGPFNPNDVKAAVAVPEIATNLAYFPLYTLNVAPVPGASIQLIGSPGQAAWYFWASANFPLGSVVSFLGSVQNAPNTLSVSNYVSITPTAYPPGATSVDILATKSSIAPAGACNCAVATGLTSGAANFQSNTMSSYTATALDASVYGHTLTVEGIGTNTAHLILRENGIFVCDLDVGCGSGPDTDYYQLLGINGTSQTQRDRFNLIAGTGVSISNSDNSGSNSSDITIAAQPCGNFASVTVTSTQLLNLGTTPVQIVAAPPAGNRIEPVAMGMEFLPGATPYNTSGTPLLNLTTLAWNTFAGDYWYSLSGVGFLNQTTKLLYVQPIPSYNTSAGFDEPEPAADFDGQALMLVEGNPGGDPTLGDGQVLVTVQYCTVPQS